MLELLLDYFRVVYVSIRIFERSYFGIEIVTINSCDGCDVWLKALKTPDAALTHSVTQILFTLAGTSTILKM